MLIEYNKTLYQKYQLSQIYINKELELITKNNIYFQPSNKKSAQLNIYQPKIIMQILQPFIQYYLPLQSKDQPFSQMDKHK